LIQANNKIASNLRPIIILLLYVIMPEIVEPTCKVGIVSDVGLLAVELFVWVGFFQILIA